MAKTQVRATQLRNNTIQSEDIDITTTGKSLITKISSADNSLTLTSSGADPGTGVVDLSLTYKRVSFRAAADGLQAVASGANVKLLFPIVDGNIGSQFDITNSRFTALVSGQYLFNTAVAWSGNQWGRMMLFVNGVEKERIYVVATNVTFFPSSSCILTLNANDYVEVYVNTSFGRTSIVPGTYFTGSRVS